MSKTKELAQNSNGQYENNSILQDLQVLIEEGKKLSNEQPNYDLFEIIGGMKL